MKSTSLFLAFLLLTVFGPRASAGALRTHCEPSADPARYFFCMHETAGSPSEDVIYFLHGAASQPLEGSVLLNATGYAEHFAAMQADWRKRGVAAPRVVEISFGPVWLLTPKNENPHTGLLETFVEKALPEIEGKLSRPHVKQRLLWGHSMGGLNSAFLMALYPALFARAAMNDPAFLEISPFAPSDEVAAYAAKLGVPVKWIQVLVHVHQVFLFSPKDWEKLNPGALAAKIGAQGGELYISAGTADPQFFVADENFANNAATAGGKVTWGRLEGGDHGAADPESVARFLVPSVVLPPGK